MEHNNKTWIKRHQVSVWSTSQQKRVHRSVSATLTGDPRCFQSRTFPTRVPYNGSGTPRNYCAQTCPDHFLTIPILNNEVLRSLGTVSIASIVAEHC